jgi:hypothetical protein
MKKRTDRNLRASWLKVKEDRESKGLPRINRREFLRDAAMTAAGISLPLLTGCGSEGATGIGTDATSYAGGGASRTGGSTPVKGAGGAGGALSVTAGSGGITAQDETAAGKGGSAGKGSAGTAGLFEKAGAGGAYGRNSTGTGGPAPQRSA